MTPAGAWIHDRLHALGGWRRSGELLAGISLDDLRLLGYVPEKCVWVTHYGQGPQQLVARLGAPRYAGRRIATHLRYLRVERLVERRIRIEDTPTGGMIPISEWRAL